MLLQIRRSVHRSENEPSQDWQHWYLNALVGPSWLGLLGAALLAAAVAGRALASPHDAMR